MLPLVSAAGDSAPRELNDSRLAEGARPYCEADAAVDSERSRAAASPAALLGCACRLPPSGGVRGGGVRGGGTAPACAVAAQFSPDCPVTLVSHAWHGMMTAAAVGSDCCEAGSSSVR